MRNSNKVYVLIGVLIIILIIVVSIRKKIDSEVILYENPYPQLSYKERKKSVLDNYKDFTKMSMFFIKDNHRYVYSNSKGEELRVFFVNGSNGDAETILYDDLKDRIQEGQKYKITYYGYTTKSDSFSKETMEKTTITKYYVWRLFKVEKMS